MRSRLQGFLLGLTLLLGVLGVAVTPSAGQTFVRLSESAQSLMSVTVAFIGVLMARDVLRSPGPARLAPMWLAATMLAVLAHLVGTGLGLLLRPAVLACLATIVLPLGLWLVLGSVPVLRPFRSGRRLTPQSRTSSPVG